MPAPLSLRIKERTMAKRAGGLSQQIAADAVGISVRSAQRIDQGELQHERQQQRRGRHWRTRADPLAEVWDSVLVPMFERAPQLEPQTLLLHLEQAFPGQEWYRRKRILQRRVEQWKAQYGPAREVMFLKHHQPGMLGMSDFTLLKGEPISVAGHTRQAANHRIRQVIAGHWDGLVPQRAIEAAAQGETTGMAEVVALESVRRSSLARPLIDYAAVVAEVG